MNSPAPSPGRLETPDPTAEPQGTSVDLPRVEAAVRELLAAIGEDPERDGLLDTPARVARMYAEVCSGLHDDPRRHLRTTFEANHDEMIMVRDITFHSLCEHHLAPFSGRAHVAYIPNEEGRITGLSKLARLTLGYAARPQVQERLTTQIAEAIEEVLAPRGAGRRRGRTPVHGHAWGAFLRFDHGHLGGSRAVPHRCGCPGGGDGADRLRPGRVDPVGGPFPDPPNWF